MESKSKTMPGYSILLVEDDKPTLDCLVIILNKKYPDATIYPANNGKTGLELFKEHMPDIVITDLTLPEKHGMQMAIEIHAIKPETKFIILTGNNSIPPQQNSHEKELKVDHFIVKPVDFQDLFSAIEQCIDEIAQHGL